ncbi:MAG TPA: hypothetical protein VEC06_20075 [Paucimonas sp.]|nr:hypothetical protein [Paucimonas sp.]
MAAKQKTREVAENAAARTFVLAEIIHVAPLPACLLDTPRQTLRRVGVELLSIGSGAARPAAEHATNRPAILAGVHAWSNPSEGCDVD